METIAHETVFQGQVQVGVGILSFPEMVQRWKLAESMANTIEQV